MSNPNKPNDRLEQALSAMRSDQPTPEAGNAAQERVWQNLSAQSGVISDPQSDVAIQGCESVRALLGAYQRRELTPARALLIQDHLRECGDCHRAVEASRRPAVLAWKQELPVGRPAHFKWLATAAAVLLAAVGVYMLQDWLAVPAGARASVESVDGALYRVSNNHEARLQPGQELGEGEKVRTAAGARARLRLRDGSLVEMNERAEFSVTARRSNTTVNLGRGDIIVQAAHRSTGHLYVDTRDTHVSVTGTVFSVSSGLKGSRVSVIEGEVRVAQAGTNNILHPGEQSSSSPKLGVTSVKQEIAWSQDLDKHLALLAEFAHLQNKLSANVQMPGLRYQSRLLPLLPQSTLLVASVPNYGDAIGQANQLFQQELQESAILREWWQQYQKSGHSGYSFDDAVSEIQQLSRFLGDEIVIAMANDNTGGEHGSVLLVAQVQKSGLADFIAQSVTEPNVKQHLRVVSEQELIGLQPTAARNSLVILVRSDLVVAGTDVAMLQAFDKQLPQGGGFTTTPFGQRMLQSYQNGAGLLFAADIGRMKGAAHMRSEPAIDRSGFADLQYLIAERKDLSGQTQLSAQMAFNGPRQGVASWLAAPASIGGLDFVSTSAGAVASVVTKSPAKMFDDMLAVGGENGKMSSHLAEAEAKLKIRLKEDLAATLGGEVTVALDGPLLPTPSWKVIADINDPVRLEQTLEQLAADVNAEQHEGYSASIEQTTSGGLTYYTLKYSGEKISGEIDYTFTDGYLIIAPTKALVMNAVQIHQSGNSLAHSSEFHALLPQDNVPGVSAVLYQNLAPVVGSVSSQLTPSQLQSLKAFAAESKPSVVCVYGEESAIRVTSTSRFFGLDLNTFTLSTLLNIGHPKGAPGNLKM